MILCSSSGHSLTLNDTMQSHFARDLVGFVIDRPAHLQLVYDYCLTKFTGARRIFYPKFQVTKPSLTLCADTAYLLYFMGTTPPEKLTRGGDAVFVERGMERVRRMQLQWREYRRRKIRRTQRENLKKLLCSMGLVHTFRRTRCFRYRQLMRESSIMALVSVVGYNKSHAFVLQRSSHGNNNDEYYLWQSHLDTYTLEDHIWYDQYRFTAAELSRWIKRKFQCHLVDCREHDDTSANDWSMVDEGTLRHQIRLTVDVMPLYEDNGRFLDTFYRRSRLLSHRHSLTR